MSKNASMNENEPLEALIVRVFTAVGDIRQLSTNHTKAIANLQETCTGLARLLENHTQALRSHQKSLEVVAHELGLESGPEEAPPPGPAN
jgi:hypothetical protein